MGTVTIVKIACDRCGHEATGEQKAFPDWAWINAARQSAEGARLGAQPGAGSYGDDLCPGCMEQLLEWWSGTATPATQPTPAAPPQRPLFTLIDRKNAVAKVADALRLRTEFALSIVRNEPTSILSGDVVPGTLFGIDDTAAGIVDGVLDALGYNRKGA